MKPYRWLAEWLLWIGYWAHEAHGPGTWFWQLQRIPRRESPLFYIWPTYEIQWPYRTSYSFVLRPPWLETALVLGHWKQITIPEDTVQVVNHLARAIGLSKMAPAEFTGPSGHSTFAPEADPAELADPETYDAPSGKVVPDTEVEILPAGSPESMIDWRYERHASEIPPEA